MISFKGIFWSILLSISWLIFIVEAHSSPARPLKRFAHPSTISIEILPRQGQLISELSPFSKRQPLPAHHLRYDDSFRLTIQAFDDTFYLHLRPNDYLIHPAARVNYYSIDDQGKSYITHSKPLLRESVKAYLGEVIAPAYSPTRMREDAAGVASPNPSSELGWARIMVHHQGNTEQGIPPQYEGAFSHKGVVYHILSKENYLRTKNELDPDVLIETVDSNLIIWRESDVMTSEEERLARRSETTTIADFKPKAQSCGHDRLSYNTDPLQNPVLQKPITTSPWTKFGLPFDLYTNGTKSRRDDVGPGGNMGTNFADHIGQIAGCPTTQRLLYMGVAADCVYVSKYLSQDAATKQILTTWNSASSLYKSTFNVSLGIIELQVQNPICPTTADSAIPWNIDCSGAELDKRLSLFSQWRGQKGGDGVGLWHLMSGCPTGSEVGIAWLATLCQQNSNTGTDGSTVSGTAVSTAGRTEWQVVAHEIGHNFGAIHDCADGCSSSTACCPLSTSTCNANGQFIMSPVAQDGEKNFSQCSIGNICSVMDGVNGEKTNTTCLIDAAAAGKTISLQMCGNGIVEQGEDCDPGNGVQSPCCDSTTCKFKAGAVCDPESSSCCTDQCSFAPSTQVCRPSADGRCDSAEFCTGNSSACPADVNSPNGQSCGSGDLKCASGVCTSVSLQCQTIGASLGLKQACPQRNDNTCQVSCQDPNKANQCILLTSLLRDGSPCGYGGTCVSGKCQSGSVIDTAKAWYTQNLQISIPVTIVAALALLAILWGLFRACSRCARRDKQVVIPPMDPAAARAQHQRLQSYERTGFATPAPAFRPPPGTPSFIQPTTASYTRVSRGYSPTHGRGPSRSNWVDESPYNGR